MALLKVTIKRKWLDLILNGQKPIEYREKKPHWIARIEGKNIDKIAMRNGYRADSPLAVFKVEKIEVVNPCSHSPANGEFLSGDTYAIHIGELIYKEGI